MSVKKAILPVAGFGTRLLPASKSIPKEMVTVVDRPAIDYVVQEAIQAGIETIILVTHPAKQSIENYFDRSAELEHLLSQKNKMTLLEEIRSIIPQHVQIVAVRQAEPLGLGHAVLMAKNIIGHEPFAVLLPDVLVDGEHVNNLGEMIAQFEQTGHAQIMVEQVPLNKVDQYGIVQLHGETNQIMALVEKPKVEQAPSNLAVVGRYVFPAQIFHYLAETSADASGEIQLTDAMAKLLQEQQIDAFTLQGKTFDCGNKVGYLQAVLHYALKRDELKQTLFDAFKNSV